MKLLRILFFFFILINIFSLLEIPQKQLFYILKLVFFVMIFTFVAIRLSFKKSKHKMITNNNKLAFKGVIIWCVFMLPSYFINIPTINSNLLLVSFILLGYLSFKMLGSIHNNEENFIKYLIMWLVPLLVGLTIAILASFMGYGDKYYISNEGRVRYIFSFTNPNALASISFIIILICLKLFSFKKLKWFGFPSIFLIIPVIIILLLTDSRTPLYATIIWLFVYSFNNFSIKYLHLYLRMFFYSVSCIILFFVSILVIRSFNYDKVDKLLSLRLTNWQLVLDSFNGTDWLIGKGLDVVAKDLVYLTNRNITFDNSYFSMFVQSGIFGYIGLSIFLILIFVSINRISDFHLKKIATATLLSWFVFSFFESSLFSTGNITSVYIWTSIGILMGITEKGDHFQQLKHKV
jgi:hypothetical protein